MAFHRPADQASEHYQPWFVANHLEDTVLPVEPESFPDFVNTKDFTTDFESMYTTADSHRATPCPMYDANEGIRLSPSPLQSKHNHGNCSFGTYCNSSPSSSPYSSNDSRTFSATDLQSATWTSPDLSLCYSSQPSPEMHMDNGIAQSIELGPFGSCSLSDVQQFSEPDSLLNFDQFNDCLPTFQSNGYPTGLNLTIDVNSYNSYESSPPVAWPLERRSSNTSDFDFATPIQPRGRQRKHSASISSTYSSTSKVSKRSSTSVASRRLSTTPFSYSSKSCSPARFARPTQQASNFPCPLAPYGCTSSFGSKNEWKRHVNTQHLRLDLWRCDQCADRDTRPNDFNRKDLFIQHLRRMHHKSGGCHSHRSSISSVHGLERATSRARSLAPSEVDDPAIAAAEQRCHIKLRQAPDSSCCLFCDATFEGPGSWEERMEHVGRHLEVDKKEGREAPGLEAWRVDSGFEAWGEREGLIVRNGEGWGVAEGTRR
ncbi:hypothetical protein CAC42_5101 [Sphaceloma murrayae]|uniref:C2H2-type domain-containing protein n=1 Tax=Sphaceloma murrayae TaxID=2082308 RepID=A0A2K1QU35_9PEZI|nr:hypothetical protein CAC42_5101 [Sphaceloma murrayae]